MLSKVLKWCVFFFCEYLLITMLFAKLPPGESRVYRPKLYLPLLMSAKSAMLEN